MSEAEAQEGAARWSVVGVALGVLWLVVAAWLPEPAGMAPQAWKVAAVAALMAAWWVGDVLPRAVTALVPLIVFPVWGVQSMRVTAAPYAHPLLYLMLGGFVLGAAMERVGLHERLMSLLLRPAWARQGPRAVLGALMVATAALSSMVSNTATTLMMLPLAVALARLGGGVAGAKPAFVLGLAYSSSIGGMATLVGTPPNAVLAAFSDELLGRPIGFGQWMWFGVPTAVCLLPLAWWAIAVRTFALPSSYEGAIEAPPVLGWRPGERGVLALVAAAMLAWLTREEKALGALVVPGWGSWVNGAGAELDAVVALCAAVVAFLLRGPGGQPLLRWQAAERAVPWSVILLLGGGFSLADAISTSGCTAWLAGGAVWLEGLPLPLTVFAVVLTLTFVTELTSNTATATIALPLLAAAAQQVGVDPLVWMVPATVATSSAFMMPVATAPNAIASEAGGVSSTDMARAGLALNLAGAIAVSALGVLWAPWVFGP